MSDQEQRIRDLIDQWDERARHNYMIGGQARNEIMRCVDELKEVLDDDMIIWYTECHICNREFDGQNIVEACEKNREHIKSEHHE